LTNGLFPVALLAKNQSPHCLVRDGRLTVVLPRRVLQDAVVIVQLPIRMVDARQDRAVELPGAFVGSHRRSEEAAEAARLDQCRIELGLDSSGASAPH
jgi:hypothetical protein